MATVSVPIQFQDSNGVWWTITRGRAGDLMQIEFVSESGERRVTTVVPIDDDAWGAVNERAWQALLDQADPV